MQKENNMIQQEKNLEKEKIEKELSELYEKRR